MPETSTPEALPIRPHGREEDDSLHDRVARARRAREAAEDRVRRRFAEMEPDGRRWWTRSPLDFDISNPHVR